MNEYPDLEELRVAHSKVSDFYTFNSESALAARRYLETMGVAEEDIWAALNNYGDMIYAIGLAERDELEGEP